MVEVKKKMGLGEIIKEEFVGPIIMRCVRARHEFVESRMLVPVEEDDLEDLDISPNIRAFPVSAWLGRIGTTYPTYVRLHGKIMECIPANYAKMASEWKTDAIPAPEGLTFVKDQRGNWAARIPNSAQLVLPLRNLTPPESGNAWTPKGLYIKPLMTRTFWLAGNRDDVVRITPHDETRYMIRYEGDGTEKPDWSYSKEFRIFGRWMTFAEITGDPLATIIEFDSFNLSELRNTFANAASDFTRWMSKVLAPILTPEAVAKKMEEAPDKIAKSLELVEETWRELNNMKDWYERWYEHWLSDFQARRASELPIGRPKLPEPIGRKNRSEPPLMSITDPQVALKKLLGPARTKRTNKSKPETTAKPRAETSKAAPAPAESPVAKFDRKAARATTPTATPPTRTRRGRVRTLKPAVETGKVKATAGEAPDTTIGATLSAETKAKLEEVVNGRAAEHERRSAAAKKGAETRRLNREKAAAKAVSEVTPTN